VKHSTTSRHVTLLDFAAQPEYDAAFANVDFYFVLEATAAENIVVH
jgi:hypothetical protein